MDQYCMLTVKGKFLSSEKSVDVDFGENEELMKLYDKEHMTKTLKVKNVVTLVDALNYMAYTGWEIVHMIPFETNMDGGTYESYRYIMKRSFDKLNSQQS